MHAATEYLITIRDIAEKNRQFAEKNKRHKSVKDYGRVVELIDAELKKRSSKE